MVVIGRIDREIFRCIAEDIVTEEVVMTDNQLQHILQRHPEVFPAVLDVLRDILRDPDYIIEDKHPYTGLVVRRLETGSESLQVVLRICTSEDQPGYKNSVISCWEISERRLKNYLRNKKILYNRQVDKKE
ncbi:MAG TPA: hypothetical protein IAB37_06660 [Candidatus Faecivivens stercoravium]|uniref:Phage-Barnase-EndoU-ColicinE5/D-RelE like nuclease 2 domain-containing protein n=1 Tax=Candidatus Faecivivens stercoravium TaxID=2840803 RepID=A0A9D1DYP8_9FIRM|nr:hypothetical protein [Candidatus Faecivivens stercoravium]